MHNLVSVCFGRFPVINSSSNELSFLFCVAYHMQVNNKHFEVCCVQTGPDSGNNHAISCACIGFCIRIFGNSLCDDSAHSFDRASR